MQDFSEERIEQVLRWSKKDQEEFFYEAFNSMSERDQRRYMNDLDEDCNVLSEKNKRKARAEAKRRMRKYKRTRPRRNSS